MQRDIFLARVGMVGFLMGVLALHLLPKPLLIATDGQLHAYDPRLNFLSEYVRTQYGFLMELNFIALALTAGGLGKGLWRTGLKREGLALAGASVCLVLLALFRTDLVDLRTDALTCGDPTRIEACTLVGRVHNPLSTIVFGFVVFAAGSLLQRRVPRWRTLGWWAVACGLLALLLVGASLLYLRTIGYTARVWVGLMQRSLVLPALLWLWGLAKKLE